MAGWYGLVDRVSVGVGRVDRDQLVAGPGAVPAGPDLKHDAVFADQLLAVLAEAGRPERHRDEAALAVQLHLDTAEPDARVLGDERRCGPAVTAHPQCWQPEGIRSHVRDHLARGDRSSGPDHQSADMR
jgi:hypothetical protein